jgi:hypothetical protein
MTQVTFSTATNASVDDGTSVLYNGSMDDPLRFGYQPNGTYAPSPEEIRKRCKEIRIAWSEREERGRRAWAIANLVEVEAISSNARLT